eukprot:CAMPEP_0183291130 /NCGR_PEP_ID=MMETSP0160_2-20130417/655_1 /TAXON_ID=2839 ORGANISM="Odontella Sinensis, Strain Grunow 1884" /NCGR_SAMPLE_ID=MMETSP0160_2 /ASSEMBLY_ACC=CAM_ASM_000250 /LENGTH=281 /DNA_ID=CAMNT_0025451889 /DNA_START=90 /DNA_END=935 /DNA_ORIENTATION=+
MAPPLLASSASAALCCLLLATVDAFVVPSATFSSRTVATTKPLNAVVDPSHLTDAILSGFALASDAVADVDVASSTAASAASEVTYSKASYYTTLGLYVLSFPGIWSQIKRSTKAKVKRKTYISPGENTDGGKDMRQQAGEIMAYMKANNYEVAEAGETITFQGLVQRSVSQACFLVFCTALGMASLALVLQIQFQDLTLPVIGTPNWFYLVLLSPYAGIYYWRSGDRVDDVRVKLIANDDETENEITVEGNDEELERMWRQMGWMEKGMVKVEGLMEGTA